jgi:hypothetical protein
MTNTLQMKADTSRSALQMKADTSRSAPLTCTSLLAVNKVHRITFGTNRTALVSAARVTVVRANCEEKESIIYL